MLVEIGIGGKLKVGCQGNRRVAECDCLLLMLIHEDLSIEESWEVVVGEIGHDTLVVIIHSYVHLLFPLHDRRRKRVEVNSICALSKGMEDVPPSVVSEEIENLSGGEPRVDSRCIRSGSLCITHVFTLEFLFEWENRED